jgi:hypothetical protein
MKWVALTLYTTSELCVSSVTTADAHTSAASSRLNSPLRRFKWTRSFRRKTKSGFCACATTFQTQSTMTDLAADTTMSYLFFSQYCLQVASISYPLFSDSGGDRFEVIAKGSRKGQRRLLFSHSCHSYCPHSVQQEVPLFKQF